MKLSCVDSLVPGKTYLEKADNLKKFGFDGIAIYADSKMWTEDDTLSLMQLKEKTGIEVAEFVLVGSGYGHLLDPDREQVSIDTVCKSLDICAALGAVTEVEFDAPRITEIDYNYNNYPLPPKELADRYVKNLKVICEHARSVGKDVLIEACNRYEREYNNLQEHSLRLLDATGYENTGLLCDLFHMSVDERDVVETLIRFGEHVKHVHLGDTNRRVPGHGLMPWKRIFDALHEINYDGYLNLECSVFDEDGTELAESCKFLHQYF